MAHLPHAAGARRRTRLLLSRSLPLLLTLCLLPSGALHQGNLFLPAVDAVSPISGGAALSPSLGAQAFRQKFLSSEARALSQAAKGFPEGVSPRPLGSARAAGGIAVAGDAAASSFAMVKAPLKEIVSSFPCLREGTDSAATTVDTRVEVASEWDCQRACRTRDDCSHAVLNKQERKCYLKTGFWEPKSTDKGASIIGMPRSCNSSCFALDASSKAENIQQERAMHSPFECLIWCRSQESCRATVYDVYGKMCHIKASHSDDQRVLRYGGVLTGNQWCNDNDAAYVPPTIVGWKATSCMHPQNSKASGAPFKEIAEVENADMCQKHCKRIETCTYFSYDRVSKVCELFEGDAASNVAEAAGYVSGPRTCNQTCFLDGQKYQKGEISNKAMYSALDCQVICQSTANCEYFSFSSTSRTCYLYDSSAKGTEIATPSSVAGARQWCGTAEAETKT
ncbi:PAN domain-containing protein [Besnoitia besnoiti]|uniref:PAN domain-containing protein n=1 Tax=Besnoitia besnoiti TaxID=94643 RepID=A0A2A9M8Y8_BESBE|nr:PAN domain-containing protein [Besnoitia besnoiti]PFH31850.1 PAN domain-containing protein [Besnoitia besnoiti]